MAQHAPSINDPLVATERPPLPKLRGRHYLAAALLWAAVALLTVALNREPLADGEIATIQFFVVLCLIAVWLSASVPIGVHIARLSATLALAAATAGVPHAMIIGLAGFTLGGISLILLKRYVGISELRSQDLFFASLWNAAAVTLPLLPAGIIYGAFGGSFGTASLLDLNGPVAYLLFALTYFACTVGMLAVWMVLRGTPSTAYLNRRVYLELVTNGFLPLTLAPLFRAVYYEWPPLRWLLVVIYVLASVLLYSSSRLYTTLANRIAELRLLNRIGQTLNGTLDFDALIETFYRELSQLLDTSSMFLALYEEDTGSIYFPLLFMKGERLGSSQRAPANGTTEYIVRTRKPLLFTENPLEGARKLGIEPVGAVPQSFVGVPLIAGDRVLGVLALRDYERARAYSQSDVQLLETIATQAAGAIANAQLYQRSQRQAGELTALHKVSLMASATMELRKLLRTICDEAIRVMPFQKVAIFLLDDDDRTLRMVESAGLSEHYQQMSAEIDVWATSRTTVIQQGDPLVVSDILEDPRFTEFMEDARHEGFSAFLDLPLYSGSNLIGSMTAYYEHPHRFEPGEIEMMQTLGAQVAIAVENARLFDGMRDRTREMETLFNASTAINASLSLKNVLRAVGISLFQAMETDTYVALVMREDHQELRAELVMRSQTGGIHEDSPTEGFTVMLDELPIVEQAVRRHAPVVLVQNGLPEQRLSEGEMRLMEYGQSLCAIAVPLIARGELIGLLVSGTQDCTHSFSAEQIRLAEAMANQAAVAIENAILFERTDIALARRLDEIESLEMISQRMTRRLDLQSVIEQVMHAAKAVTTADFAEVALYDDNTKQLIMAARRSDDGDRDVVTHWPATQGLTGRVIQTGQPLLVDDVTAEPDYFAARQGIRSEMVVPIVLEGYQLGVLNLESTRSGAFNAGHLRFVTSLAEHAAIAIQNARLFEAVQRRAEEFNTLRTIAMELLASPDVKHVLRTILGHALERTHAQDVHIYLYDHREGKLSFGASLWADGSADVEFAPPRPNGLTMTVAHTGERIVIGNAKQHPLYQPDEKHSGPAHSGMEGWASKAIQSLEAIVGVPLKRGEDVVGVFNIAFDDAALLNEDVLRYLDFLAAEAAVAIANAELQEETRRGRDLLHAILDSSHDGIVMFDMHQRLVMANSRAEWLMNARLSSALGKDLFRVLRVVTSSVGDHSPFTARKAREMARLIMENPREITRRQYMLASPTFRAIEEVSLPVIGHNDEVLGRMFILRDVTQEHELETFREEMSHMLVHDLRSPLGGVITGVHTAIDEIANGLETEHGPDLPIVSTMLQVALTSAEALLRLVESILDINKLETGDVPLRLEPIHLKHLAERARLTLEQTAKEAAIQVTIEAPDDLPALAADEEKIGRVLINLLDNALRYTPQGGRVWITIQADAICQTVIVRDSGEGVSPEMRDRIFERFVQADPSRRKRGTKGSGLGLTFCKLAVESHGGHIWVDEGPEGGAAFHFTLPAS